MARSGSNKPSKNILKEHERHKLAAATDLSLGAIRRWERGDTVLRATSRALNDAARKLGLPVPETAP